MSTPLEVGVYSVIVDQLILDSVSGEYSWNPEVVNVSPDEHLTINDQDVDSELVRMGQLVAYYGDLAAQLKAQLARREEDKEAVEAMLDLTFRDAAKAAQAADPKVKPPTVEGLKKAVAREESYLIVVAEIQTARLHHYRVDNLMKALIKKADSLNTLAHNQRQERKVY